MTKMMIEAGFPFEDDVYRPESQTVFSFPMMAPDKAVTVDDIDAMDQLELWLSYQNNWCEHKPSMTVYIRESEWMEVGAWVYKHFDSVSGIAFLPYSGHTYKQAPYEVCSQAEHDALLAKMPKDVDWSNLRKYETDDTSVSHKEMACSGNSCELVDLVR
jgi:ribonucleoside-triphosphate reductase